MDDVVDILDIVIIVDCIIEYSQCPCADINQDGLVDVLDLVMIVQLILSDN
jgi:hypothetical protein